MHGVGGIFGTLMIAVFGAGAWVAQLGGLVIVGVYTTVVTVALIYICKASYASACGPRDRSEWP